MIRRVRFGTARQFGESNMAQNQKPTAAALLPVLTALGVSASAATYCIPFLTGEKKPAAETATVAESVREAESCKLLTLTEAGKRLGVSRATVWRMVKDGKLSTIDPTGRGKGRVRLADIVRLAAGTAA